MNELVQRREAMREAWLRRSRRVQRHRVRRAQLASGPLRRIGPGRWQSRDGHWTFLRHESDPSPKRWYAYEADDEHPFWDGTGDVTLAAVLERVVKFEQEIEQLVREQEGA